MNEYLNYLDEVYDDLVSEYGEGITFAYHVANEKEMWGNSHSTRQRVGLIMSDANDSLTLMNNLTKEGQKMDKLNEALEALQQANKMFAEMFDIDESEAN